MTAPLVIAILPDPAAGTGIQMIQITDQTPGAVWDGATLFTGEEQSADVAITDHPVETGTTVTDNARPEPAEVTFTVAIANTPTGLDSNRAVFVTTVLDIPKKPLNIFSLGALAGAAIGAIGDALFGAPPKPTVTGATFTDYDPPAEAYANLSILKDSATLCTVITSTGTLESMLIKSLKVSKKDAGGSEFTITLRQIFTVSSSTVDAPRPLEPRGVPAKSAGSQAPKPPTAAEKSTILGTVVSLATGG